MNQQRANDSSVLWHRLVASHRAFALALQEFLAGGTERVAVLREALRGSDRNTALYVAPSLTVPERMELFPEWVFLASWGHGAIQAARDMILSLPRDWELARIEQEAEPFLRDGSDDEYRRLLELYELLDRDLALALAHRAAAHADPDIREAGEEFLDKLRTALQGPGATNGPGPGGRP
jgi:hypothetical protein